MEDLEWDMAGRAGHGIKKVSKGWPLRRWTWKEGREFAKQLSGGTGFQAKDEAQQSP